MIDFIKLDITSIGKEKLEARGIVFNQPVLLNHETGELTANKGIRAEYIANYKNLLFELFKGGKIILSGSLHRYYNDGLHNYNNFNFAGLNEVILDLQQRFGIDPKKSTIHHIEFGLNLFDLPYSASQIVQNLMIHSGKGNPLEVFKYHSQKTPSEYKSIVRDWYTLKTYDKGKHYQRKEEIFRIECKATKMNQLNKLGISTLEDLTKIESMDILLNVLKSIWAGVLLNDWTIQEENLTPIIRNQLKDWRNIIYWINLKKECQIKNRNKFNYELNDYHKIVQEHSENVHKVIFDSLVQNWCKNTTIERVALNLEKMQEHHLVMDDLAPIPSKVCKITGIDISNQKEGSYYLRESTIEKIYIEAKEKYQFLKDEFGPKKKQIESLKDEFEAIAKNIRNRDSNPRKRERDIFEKFKTSLFPYEPRIPIYSK